MSGMEGDKFIKDISASGPHYRNASQSTTVNSFYLKIIAQTFMALPFFLWLLTIAFVSGRGISVKSNLIPAIVFFYFLPFILTNADPRFRLPVDAVIILDIVYRLSLLNKNIDTDMRGF